MVQRGDDDGREGDDKWRRELSGQRERSERIRWRGRSEGRSAARRTRGEGGSVLIPSAHLPRRGGELRAARRGSVHGGVDTGGGEQVGEQRLGRLGSAQNS